MIETRQIEKSFGPLKALDGVALSVPTGSVFALLGPNGAGKTTMVRILSTLMKPDAGTAVVAGHDVVRAARQVRAAISLTGQYAAVDELLTGEENLRLMARLARLSRAQARRRTEELLEQFDLVGARARVVKNYSGGMRRRLDLALSLIARPQVIFLDEPTTGLDPRSRVTVWHMVKQLADDGVTVLLTTQYLEEADQLADRVAVLDGGAVVAEGTASELKRRVPGARIELTFTHPDALRVAHTRLDGRAEELTLSVPTDGSVAHIKQVLDKLHDVDIAELSVRKPTLDDVFLRLTGGEPA